MEEEPRSKLCVVISVLLLLNTILAMALPSFLGFSFADVLTQAAAAGGVGGGVSPDFLAIYGSFVAAESLAILSSLLLVILYFRSLNGLELEGCCQKPGLWSCLAGIMSLYPLIFMLVISAGAFGTLFLGGGLICAGIAGVLGCGIGIADCCCSSDRGSAQVDKAVL